MKPTCPVIFRRKIKADELKKINSLSISPPALTFYFFTDVKEIYNGSVYEVLYQRF